MERDRGPGAYKGMSLFTKVGERKYLSPDERQRFYDALPVLADPKARTFCEMLFWTGCRPSEALALSALNIDVEEGAVIVCSLKKRGERRGREFRSIPVPRNFIATLDEVHAIRAARLQPDGGRSSRLWTFRPHHRLAPCPRSHGRRRHHRRQSLRQGPPPRLRRPCRLDPNPRNPHQEVARPRLAGHDRGLSRHRRRGGSGDCGKDVVKHLLACESGPEAFTSHRWVGYRPDSSEIDDRALLGLVVELWAAA